MIEGCPVRGVCLLANEQYGFLVSKFRNSDELACNTLGAVYQNQELIDLCKAKNPDTCDFNPYIPQAVIVSRRKPEI